MIDSLLKNVGAYVGFFALAITVGAMESVHVQYQAHRSIDPMETADATIAYILPTLVLLLGSMKLPSLGKERVAERVQDKTDSLLVETPVEHRAGALRLRPADARTSGGAPSSSGSAVPPTPPIPPSREGA